MARRAKKEERLPFHSLTLGPRHVLYDMSELRKITAARTAKHGSQQVLKAATVANKYGVDLG